MSAAQWRRAMNSGAAGAVAPLAPSTPRPGPRPARAPAGVAASAPIDRMAWLRTLLRPHRLVLLAALVVYPFVASPFLTYQVAAQALILGLIALSLSFLAGYGGMVSLAQMTVAGIAGYAVAILGVSSPAEIGLNWPWWVAVPMALVVATAIATLIGWLSVRTEGIYTIMITLAIGVAFYYLALQNYSIFNGFQGLREIYAPTVFGVDWRQPVAFYFLALVLGIAGYALVRWVVASPFGIALQGIRDNPRRMLALGYDVVAHRVAAYALAGLLASVGGVLFVWYNGLITPGSVGTSWLINVLVIAVLGGMRHPIGAFLGAIVFVLLQTFAIDVVDRERFNLLIGGVFLAIVLFSPDGLLGLWAKAKSRLVPKSTPRPHQETRQ